MSTNSNSVDIQKKENIFSFIVNLTQRYYHFIVVSKKDDFTISDVWKTIPFKLSRKTNHIINKNILGIEIQQRQIESNIALRQRDEEDEDLEPPYYYDLFIVQVDDHFIILFPFRILAKRCTEELMSKMGDLEFWKLNMNDFVQSKYENASKKLIPDFGIAILGLEVGTKGVDHLNSVSITGEHPLDSNFYLNFLKNPIESKEFTINNIHLKGSTIFATDLYPKSRAKVHLDFHGNGKLYVHIGGKNILIMAFLWKSLIESKCLVSSDENPIPRLRKDY